MATGRAACDACLTHNTLLTHTPHATLPLPLSLQVALLTAAQKAGLDPKALKATLPRLAVIPFESDHKFMAAVVPEAPGSKAATLWAKGAVDVLLKACSTQPAAGDDGSGKVQSAEEPRPAAPACVAPFQPPPSPLPALHPLSPPLPQRRHPMSTLA